jgi:hypothetical protein
VRSFVCAIVHDRRAPASRDAVSDVGFGCTGRGFLP